MSHSLQRPRALEEYSIARMWTDSRIARVYAGANEVMKDLIARYL